MMNLQSEEPVINSNNGKKIQDPICNKTDVEIMDNKNNNNKKDAEREEKETLFTPYSLSSHQSHSRSLVTNTAFLYETDDEGSSRCHGSMSLLNIDEDVIYQYSDDTDNDNDYDYDEFDSIPLIDRITPPPPLYINDIDNNADDEYEEYKKYHDIDINDSDDEEIPNKNKLYLSIKIPSLKISDSAPIHSQNLSLNGTLSIFDICNTITPISSDNDGDYYYDEFVKTDDNDNDNYNYNHKENNDKSHKYNVSQTKLPKMEKKFNWNINDSNYLNINNNYYLQQHVQSLIVQNISR